MEWRRILLAVFLCVPAWGATWHVAQESLPGISGDRQVRSIAEAVSRLEAGDTAIIHGGIYREQVVIDKSGTTDAPIAIEAATGEYVVVTGADRLTEWQKAEGDAPIVSTDWPHQFISWNQQHTHPSDDFHRLIGRCEQVFVEGYLLRQVLEKGQLSRGTFFVDLDAKRLYVWDSANRDISNKKILVEASVRDTLWVCKGSHIRTQGIRFRYSANRAQQGAVQFQGDDNQVEDCVFEYTNACGAAFRGQRITVRNCTFQYNGQMGFGASRAHDLLMTGCVVRNNNTKGYDRGWEAGGDKIALARGVIIENSLFTENRGNGIWFDIGNEKCQVRNCLIADNENAGIFYEISYGLHAHDNVIVGNGLAFSPGAWGANAGISISSSPGCLIERNLLIGNKEGFSFREQKRSTPLIDGGSEPVWNHDEIIRNNVFAYNRDAQVWGWFDIDDQRHWPKSEARSVPVRASEETPHGVTTSSLEDLKLTFENNLYCPAVGQGLFNWGVTWKKNKKYTDLDTVRRELGLEQGSEAADIAFKDLRKLDLRVPADSPIIKMQCYPQGEVFGVKLGTYTK